MHIKDLHLITHITSKLIQFKSCLFMGSWFVVFELT